MWTTAVFWVEGSIKNGINMEDFYSTLNRYMIQHNFTGYDRLSASFDTRGELWRVSVRLED